MKIIELLLILFVSWQASSQDLLMQKAENTLKRNSVIPFKINKFFDSIESDQKNLNIRILKDSINNIEIYVKNTSKDSIKIETQRGALFMIKEAKNQLGDWKPIEYWLYSDSGSAYSNIVLQQNEIIKSVSKSNEGHFQTEMRIKLYTENKVYYSNNIPCSIHMSHFELPDIVMKYRISYILNELGGEKLLYQHLFLEENHRYNYTSLQKEANKK